MDLASVGVKQSRSNDLVAALKLCAKQNNTSKGSKLHAYILKKGLMYKDRYIGNNLVNMYAKSGALAKAKQVFWELPVQDLVSWNTLMTGYVQHGHGKKALSCFHRLQHEGFFPNSVTLTCTLKACGSMGTLIQGKQVHAKIIRQGLLDSDTMLGNCLIDMYAKCCALTQAQHTFEKLSVRNVVSCNTLIAAYAQHRCVKEAFNCYEWMKYEGLAPDAVTFSSLLKICGSIGASKKGKEIHVEILKEGFLDKNNVLGTALVDMYAKCGALTKAQEVFDELPVRDAVAWTTLISAHCQYGFGDEALNCFEQMELDGHPPDAVTYSCVLKSCGCIGALERGQEIHSEIVRQGLLSNNRLLGTALVDMYSKSGALSKAQAVFVELPVKDIVSLTALITGFAQHGYDKEALKWFDQLQREGFSPNALTFSCILKACGSLGAAKKGEEIHAQILKERLLGKDSVLGTALVDMYAKCGLLEKAQKVFDDLPIRDSVSYNALITGYAQHGHGEEALNCYDQMRRDGLSPDTVTFSCLLKACGSIGAADKGEKIHSEIIREGLLGNNTILDNALVDMYAKCCKLEKAQIVFDKLCSRDVATWTALIAGYVQIGNYESAFDIFNKMTEDGVIPDLITFTVVLNACNYSGLLSEGKMHFDSMSIKYGLIPSLEHHTCMVGIYGRAGFFGDAMAVISRMPSYDYLPAWFSLLHACRKWGNVEIGKLAFDHAVRLDAKSGVPYIFMRDIYSSAGMQEDVNRIEAMRVRNEAWTDVNEKDYSEGLFVG